MNSLEELETKKQQKLQEKGISIVRVHCQYRRTKNLKTREAAKPSEPAKPRSRKPYTLTIFNGVRCGSQHFPLVLDCFRRGEPFVHPVTKKVQYFRGMINKKKIEKEECSILLQQCEPSQSDTVMDAKIKCEEDPKITSSGPTESCSNSADKVVVK